MTKKTNSAALTVVERAVVALGVVAETVQDLTTLAEKHRHIVAITNDDGREQANRARLDLRAARLEIVRRGKSAREDATAYSKAVIAEETKLVALVEPEEDRLAKLVEQFDAAAEAEEARKAQAELDRVANLQHRVEWIRRFIDLPANPEPQYVLDTITELEAVIVDGLAFEDYEQQARDAKIATLSLLNDAHEAAVARIAREEQARKDQAELAELRRQKAIRDEADRKREAEAQAGRDEIARVERLRQEHERKAQEPAVTRETTVERVPAAVGAPMSDLVHRGPPAQTPGSTDAQFASLQKKADVTPTVVENIDNVAMIVHHGDGHPSFDTIVEALAFHFDADEAEVRTWIVDATPRHGESIVHVINGRVS